MKRLLAFGALGAAVAAAVVLSGVIPLKSDGHWAITHWFLDFTKRRSVATHSIGIEVPPLDDRSLIMSGAGHYDFGCKPCHGSPGMAPPPIPERMTPHPPDLRQQVGRWTPAELFTIVRGGIKFTGMPAWPAPERDDEVWAVVAFLRRLPNMSAEEYLRFSGSLGSGVQGSTVHGSEVLARCEHCHGAGGSGRAQGATPRLAGQKVEYLRRALQAYASGARHSGTMTPVAAALNAEQLNQLADHFSGSLVRPTPAVAPLSALGEQIVTRGIPSHDVPACAECHGPNPREKNPAYPRLTGQYPEYLQLQLRLFRENRRGGSEYADIMRTIALRLTDEQANAAAHYFAGSASEK